MTTKEIAAAVEAALRVCGCDPKNFQVTVRPAVGQFATECFLSVRMATCFAVMGDEPAVADLVEYRTREAVEQLAEHAFKSSCRHVSVDFMVGTDPKLRDYITRCVDQRFFPHQTPKPTESA